jgi:predicted transcriptional regulator
MFLYTKLRRTEVLDHMIRGKIQGYVIANPGAHYNQIKYDLDLNNGSLAYHLKVLEREGYIKSMRDGMYKRFYPSSAKVPKERLTPMQRRIVEQIRKRDGVSQARIAKLIEESPQVVNYHMGIMSKAGIVRLKKHGRETLCYLNGGYREVK